MNILNILREDLQVTIRQLSEATKTPIATLGHALKVDKTHYQIRAFLVLLAAYEPEERIEVLREITQEAEKDLISYLTMRTQ